MVPKTTVRVCLAIAVSCLTLFAASALRAQTYTFTHFAGAPGGAGGADSTAFNARFNYTVQLARDSQGNIYVPEYYGHDIRKITPAGVVTTFAGLNGARGSLDGIGSAARFSSPYAVAVDRTTDTVYVADTGNATVRKITSAGVVTTLAGLAGSYGTIDGTGSAARFLFLNGIAVSPLDGSIYVMDYNENTIRKVTPGGVSSRRSRALRRPRARPTTRATARFKGPAGGSFDAAGNLYVADESNCTIRKVTPAAAVTTLAGLAGSCGVADGTGSGARFFNPVQTAADAAGNVYVADFTSDVIRKLTSTGVVTTIAGAPLVVGSDDGAGTVARFFGPSGLVLDSTNTSFLISDQYNWSIRKVDLATFNVTTFAGLGGSGSADGTGLNARFNRPYFFKIDPATGNLFVPDTSSQTIRKVTPAGVVTTFAGVAGVIGGADGTVAAARFYYPYGTAVDGQGNVFVADTYGQTIRKIAPGGVVTTLAGQVGVIGTSDGTGAAAHFRNPTGVATDTQGNVFVADTDNHAIRRVTPAGVVTTFAGLRGTSGAVNGAGTAARFNYPHGIAVDAVGNVFVADNAKQLIRKITPAELADLVASGDRRAAQRRQGDRADVRPPARGLQPCDRHAVPQLEPLPGQSELAELQRRFDGGRPGGRAHQRQRLLLVLQQRERRADDEDPGRNRGERPLLGALRGPVRRGVHDPDQRHAGLGRQDVPEPGSQPRERGGRERAVVASARRA